MGLVCNFGFLAPGLSVFQPAVSPAVNSKPSTPLQTALNTTSPSPSAPPALDLESNLPLLDSASAVIKAIEAEDYSALAALVHPEKGLVLTPYSTVDLETDLTLTATQISGLAKDDHKYLWGVADGKGDPIEMTISQYFDRYVYNADFANAPVLGIDQVMGSGNALENVKEVFPLARFVEYYFPGRNPDHMGFDWCGLKLVFEPWENQYRLIALIHSEWTI